MFLKWRNYATLQNYSNKNVLGVFKRVEFVELKSKNHLFQFAAIVLEIDVQAPILSTRYSFPIPSFFVIIK